MLGEKDQYHCVKVGFNPCSAVVLLIWALLMHSNVQIGHLALRSPFLWPKKCRQFFTRRRLDDPVAVLLVVVVDVAKLCVREDLGRVGRGAQVTSAH